MSSELVNDRGVLAGTRITVYNLLPELLDPTHLAAYGRSYALELLSG